MIGLFRLKINLNKLIMKKILFLAILAVSSLGFYSCDDDDSPEVDDYTLTMGADYVNDVYYSLANGVVAEVNRLEWDIAFGVSAMSSSIIINEGSGVVLKEFPIDEAWQWADAIDTVGYSTWGALYNGDEEWEDGAFGANATGGFNFGWGDYNPVNHNVEGVSLYVIKTRNNEYKQIFIEIKHSLDQIYIFKLADLDGSNQQNITLDVSDSEANFVYYNLESNVRLDREPDASTWDLVFTKYYDNSIPYVVSGVLQNIDVLAIAKDNVTDLTDDTYNEEEFSDLITTIGSNWKVYEAGAYGIDSDRMYFVKDLAGDVYKIVFTDFGGGLTGNVKFDIKKLTL